MSTEQFVAIRDRFTEDLDLLVNVAMRRQAQAGASWLMAAGLLSGALVAAIGRMFAAGDLLDRSGFTVARRAKLEGLTDQETAATMEAGAAVEAVLHEALRRWLESLPPIERGDGGPTGP